jgi:hypothetical protein
MRRDERPSFASPQARSFSQTNERPSSDSEVVTDRSRQRRGLRSEGLLVSTRRSTPQRPEWLRGKAATSFASLAAVDVPSLRASTQWGGDGLPGRR